MGKMQIHILGLDLSSDPGTRWELGGGVFR